MIKGQRYTVVRALIEAKDREKNRFLVLDDGIPSVAVNQHLLIMQENQARPCSTYAYNLCLFLNAMDELDVSLTEVTLNNIYYYIYCAFVEEGKTFKTITSYIYAIASLYESLALRNYPLDKSLYRPFAEDSNGPRIKRNRKDVSITMISNLRNEFAPKKTDNVQTSYTKWYSADEINAISAELSITYRCIFLITICTGYRFDSAKSMTIISTSLQNRLVRPTRTKTGQMHTSIIPPMLADMMQTYLIEERRKVVASTGSTSPYYFLGKNGLPVEYSAYYSALKRVGEKASEKNPDLHIENLHPHAGRSTFAAALRSYQLEQRRQGKPTFTDTDFCTLMDWTSLECLENYDIATRAQEVSPLLSEFYSQYFGVSKINIEHLVTTDSSLKEV